MQYYASTVPIMRESTAYRQNLATRRKPVKLELADGFALMERLEQGDALWLMMGSTNAAVALGAFRHGVEVHQLSFTRAQPYLANVRRNGEKPEGRTQITATDVLSLSQTYPELFYPMYPQQAEVLGIIAAWQQLVDIMKARMAYANIVRSRMQYQAIVRGRVGTQEVATSKELKQLVDGEVGTKDPQNPQILAFLEQEGRAGRELERVCSHSEFFQHVFGSIEGLGPRIGARLIAGIERIERFKRPEDLSNLAGMLPRGKEGKLPSKKTSKGETLSRKPGLNTACFLFQDQMFGYGAKTPLGQRLRQQIDLECLCTQEQRNADPELRKRYASAVTQARIALTRHLLEKIIWPRWRQYIQSAM